MPYFPAGPKGAIAGSMPFNWKLAPHHTMNIKKILVPMDGSPNSFRGLNMAMTIADSLDASITVLHCMYEPAHSEFKRAGSISNTQKNEIDTFMKKAQQKLEKNGTRFKSKLVYGNTGYSILKMAHSKSEKFDMVVIGSRGRGSLKEVFFGSTSNYIIHSSKIPVLVVK